MPLPTLTTTTGRVWVSGAVAFGGFTLPTARFELGKQEDAWVLLRDEQRVAISLHLSTAPSIKLWNTIKLPLRCGGSWVGLAWGVGTGRCWEKAGSMLLWAGAGAEGSSTQLPLRMRVLWLTGACAPRPFPACRAGACLACKAWT